MASDPPQDPKPEAAGEGAAEVVVVAGAVPVAEAVVSAEAAVVSEAAAVAVLAEPVVEEAVPPGAAEAAAPPAPPPVPAEPVSPAKEWAIAVALMIVLGLMAFQFVTYLRDASSP